MEDDPPGRWASRLDIAKDPIKDTTGATSQHASKRAWEATRPLPRLMASRSHALTFNRGHCEKSAEFSISRLPIVLPRVHPSTNPAKPLFLKLPCLTRDLASDRWNAAKPAFEGISKTATISSTNSPAFATPIPRHPAAPNDPLPALSEA